MLKEPGLREPGNYGLRTWITACSRTRYRMIVWHAACSAMLLFLRIAAGTEDVIGDRLLIVSHLTAPFRAVPLQEFPDICCSTKHARSLGHSEVAVKTAAK